MDATKTKDIITGCITVFLTAAVSFLLITMTHSIQKTDPVAETLDPLTTTTYTGTADSSSPYGGDMTLTVSVNAEGQIVDITIGENNATEGVGTKAIDALPDAIIAAQSTDVDGVTGASITSKAIITAVNDALAQADSAKEAN